MNTNISLTAIFSGKSGFASYPLIQKMACANSQMLFLLPTSANTDWTYHFIIHKFIANEMDIIPLITLLIPGLKHLQKRHKLCHLTAPFFLRCKFLE